MKLIECAIRDAELGTQRAALSVRGPLSPVAPSDHSPSEIRNSQSDRRARLRARQLRRDLRVLARFILIYCQHRHSRAERIAVELKSHDVGALLGEPVRLCPECSRLLAHAFTKRTHCPLDPKPACKHCPKHCYHPRYRAAIREVMKYSGRKLVLSGRIDYLLHLLF